MKVVANRPTKCAQLVPGWPHFVGFCDACKYGAGGVWISGKDDIHPTLWCICWPPDIVELFNQQALTVNDLEMAGLLLEYLVLEQIVDSLVHKHAAAWCDNTSTVSWARRLSSSRDHLLVNVWLELCPSGTWSLRAPHLLPGPLLEQTTTWLTWPVDPFTKGARATLT